MARRGTNKLSSVRRRFIREILIKKYGPVCQKCGKLIDLTLTNDPMQFSIGHKVPWSVNRTNKMDNLQPEHLKCNNEDPNNPH